MKNTLVLTSLIAIVATGAANAATDVTFAGTYTATTGTEKIVAGAPSAYAFSYTGTNVDGTDTDPITSDTTTGVALSNFKYSLATATLGTADLSDGKSYEASEYIDNSAAANYANVHVADDYALNAAEPVVDSSYSYLNPQYDSSDETSQQYIQLNKDGSARTLTESYATNGTYTTGSTTITSTTAATDLIGLYSYQTKDTDGNPTSHKYVLSDDGTGIKDLDNDGQGVDLTSTAMDAGLKTALEDMITAYKTDSGAAFTAAKDALVDLQTQENNNFSNAKSAYNDDLTAQSALATNYATYKNAKTAYDNATKDTSDYQVKLKNYNKDTDSFNSAFTLYNTPIETVQAATLQDAKDYADGLASNYDVAGAAATAETNANAYADSLASNYDAAGAASAEQTRAEAAEGTLQSNIDAEADTRAAADTALQTNINTEVARATAAEGVLQSNIDAEAGTRAAADTQLQSNIVAEAGTRAAADTALQTKIDNEVARATAQEAAIRGEIAAGDALTLTKANAYTDSKVNALEKNVSGGVAAATALSAVNVANVGKGEVSVGGGYGYYNSQSAMAFGAAMGLSDKWSVNAGAGIAQGDKTQFSIRAGTNYKFKLF